MQLRSIKEKLSANKLGLGGASLGNLYQPVSDEDAIATINAAWNNGVRYFDTAPLYGYGLSEERLGQALSRYNRDEFVVSTKVGRLLMPSTVPNPNEQFPDSHPCTIKFDYTCEGILESFQSSVKRLGFKPDIVFIHDLGEMTHGANHPRMLADLQRSGWKALQQLREEGIAIGLGVNEVAICMKLMSLIPLDYIMLAGRYTLLEQQTLENFFPACERHNIGVIIAGPYNSGILTGDETNRKFNYADAESSVIERVNKLKVACVQHNTELRRAAIQFPALHPQVVAIVAGARSAKEIEDTVKNFNKPIPLFFWLALKSSGLIASTSPVIAVNPVKEIAPTNVCASLNRL